ncbi:MAG TPA: hypothetical protein DEG43_03835, partial [Acidimicrobiaceae bacterium]|nr:hypothetical protein [Acidimicrobiaceae bacterium]
NAAAESMLTNAWLGLRFGPEVGPSPQGPPKRFPSDWTDVVYYSQKAVGCTVEGFAPSADAIAGLDVPDALKRAMQLAESNELAWLNALEGRITSEIHVQIPALVTEAWAVRFLSPRASVVLLRSAAELVAENLGAGGRANFNKKLEGLEARWDAEAPDRLPAGRRETVWRAGILSCFHTVREIGNRIHSDSVVAPSEVALAHNSIQRLVEAVLRTGPLDKAGPT